MPQGKRKLCWSLSQREGEVRLLKPNWMAFTTHDHACIYLTGVASESEFDPHREVAIA